MLQKFLNKIILFTILFLSGCSDMFEYSPYDTDISKYHPNSAEADLINTSTEETDTLAFIVLSDVHDNYDDLAKAIKKINKIPDIKFIICCGDLTNSGLSQQYEWYVDIIEKSHYPFISIIGNHDYRSNGQKIYTKVFGSTNYSFICDDYKFILFDNVIWENGNRIPNYSWLENKISEDNLKNIVISHIPPWDNQMKGDNDSIFRSIVKPENTFLCIHGHNHKYEETIYNGIHTLVSEAINDHKYYIVKISGSNFSVTECSF